VAIPSAYARRMTNASLPTSFGSTAGVLPVLLMASNNGVVFYNSHNAGQARRPLQPIAGHGLVSVASIVDSYVSVGGPDLNVSHDSGSTWSVVTPTLIFMTHWLPFQYAEASTGWALTGDANSHHSFCKTTDGGATWRVLIP